MGYSENGERRDEWKLLTPTEYSRTSHISFNAYRTGMERKGELG